MPDTFYTYNQVRADLLARREIALLDVREEAPFAEAHPLFAANLPLSRLEAEAYNRIPNRQTTLVIYDNGEGLAPIALKRLVQLGYKHVHLLDGGLNGWRKAGGEIFKDVNTPSKAFGELVESKKHTPSLTATEVKSLLDAKKNIMILDARRYDEYHTMSIPSGISVPGEELVLRVKELAPGPKTTVIVNCAGRTRSIIGTQSLINAGIVNPVYALRNGTIGWTLAGHELEHGQTRNGKNISLYNQERATISSRRIADAAGVKRLTGSLSDYQDVKDRTHYFFDVRSYKEFTEGHLPGFLWAPGGQLVQETDHFAPVRGARIILFDNLEVRANMTASWLAQMAWEVYVLEQVHITELNEKGAPSLNLPPLPELRPGQFISAALLKYWLDEKTSVVIIDLATASSYTRDHIPGAYFALRSQLKETIKNLPAADNYVLTSPDGIQACFTLAELNELTGANIYVLKGGTNAWISKNYTTANGASNNFFASPQIDRYRRPYEGTGNSAAAMQAYLDWEYGLVEQLARDATHGFFVI
jgi:rhodanese-related sulfurtransferase